ncbi:MAG: CDP-diacylglycerol--glycerol-3-phosphate 3-phosphatidyltransferase [SAR116 cluster bacterium MED-G04]|jgi:cardiolipin synthase|nr:MAG: CDP-diacylglycerol--glycerol-3-phosphate 3-phosphatidyltransferase [SAR116 cluster bacterium MED-G04]|tara:strand:- start:835 stop:1392 length:558 start_codon:yes stop_codon:yes gene_type:complete
MIKSLPNAITLFRTAASLIIPLLMLQGDEITRWAALILYALAAGTDWLDGLLARQLDAITTFGRMLDPIADKLLMAGCLFALLAMDNWGWLFFVPALLIILREVLIAGLREFVAGHSIILHVTWLAKFKTTAQLVAVGFAISVPLMPPLWPVEMVTIGLIWLAAFLTVASGWDYFQKALQHDFFS